MAAVARWERRTIGERTKAALAQVKARGQKLDPRFSSDEAIARILGLRSDGLTYAEIAAALDEEGVAPSPNAARWYPATVGRVVRAYEALEAAAQG